MENADPVVNSQPTTGVVEGTEPVVESSQSPVVPPAGTKTDPNLLLKSLQEERDRRRKLEEELQSLKNSTVSSEEEIFSEEGRALKKHITDLEAKFAAVEDEKNLDRLYATYPALKEKAAEFNEFRAAEHPRAKIESVAKLFLAENGLMGEPRKGLEKPTGGTRVAPSPHMTADDVKSLRENDYRKYVKMLQEGKITLE